jgi:hypothetical protein
MNRAAIIRAVDTLNTPRAFALVCAVSAALVVACGLAPGHAVRADGQALGTFKGCPPAVDDSGAELAAFADDLATALGADLGDVLDVVASVHVFCLPRDEQRVQCANAFRDDDPEECLAPDGGGLRVAPGVLPGVYVSRDAADVLGLVQHGMAHHVLRALVGHYDVEHRDARVRAVLPAWLPATRPTT